jgi:ketosteroid isomerase-like protein
LNGGSGLELRQVVQFVEKDKKIPKQPGSTPQDSESELRPTMDEFHRGLQPEMRRPKPNNDAMAAALEVIQRMAADIDTEDAVDDLTEETAGDSSARVCRVCGHRNREGHKFCGMCGLPVDSPDEPKPDPAPGKSSLSPQPMSVKQPAYELREPSAPPRGAVIAETHHYHHHYHHHYLPGGQEGPAPRATAEVGRETDKLRASAALRGESMSRAEAAVRRVTQEWVLACNTKHLDDLLDLYHADSLVLRSNYPPIRGASAVREFFFGGLDAGLGEAEVEPIRVEIVGDMAYEAGRCKALVPGAAGKRREERGKYVWVLARQTNGEWKITVDCWSSDLTLNALESDIAPATAAKVIPPRKTV